MESNTIYPIPLDQRRGRVHDLFTVWFGCNLMILTVATGALGTTAYGLPLFLAIVANAAGMSIGAVFMALHAAQGPHLGVPQMVQTRGQFGSWGAVPMIVLIIVMYIGFAASNWVLGAQTLQVVVPALGQDGGIVGMIAATLIPAIVGYSAIHATARAASWAGGIGLAFCLISAAHHLAPSALSAGHMTATGMVGCFSTGALWQIAYAPYVSDASRYLPPTRAGSRAAFWASYGGTFLGSLLPMALGAVLGVVGAHGDIAQALAVVAGPGTIPLMMVLTFSLAIASAMNIYCGSLSAITVWQTFASRWRPHVAGRLVVSAILVLVAGFVALVARAHFLGAYMAFLELLMAVLAPWSAVNLVDYYLIRRGSYDVASFFASDGGIYGRFNVPALVAYGAGVAIQVPFLATSLYTGPLARQLGRVDVSWIVGVVVTSLLYLSVMRSTALQSLKRSKSDDDAFPDERSGHQSQSHR